MTALLEKLREERAGHNPVSSVDCSCSGFYVSEGGEPSIPCLHARALDVAIAAAEVHKPFGIYEECGHDHDEQEIDGDSGVIVVEALDKPYTCNEGLLYRVCEACHTDSGEVREDTGDGLWPCSTYKRMEAAYQGTARRIGDQGEE